MAVNVRDGIPVAPGDLLAGETEGHGHSISFGRAWRPAAFQDRACPLFAEIGLRCQLPKVDAVFGTQLLNRLLNVHRQNPDLAKLLADADLLQGVRLHQTDQPSVKLLCVLAGLYQGSRLWRHFTEAFLELPNQ